MNRIYDAELPSGAKQFLFWARRRPNARRCLVVMKAAKADGYLSCALLFAQWRRYGRDELAFAGVAGWTEVVAVVGEEVVVVIADSS